MWCILSSNMYTYSYILWLAFFHIGQKFWKVRIIMNEYGRINRKLGFQKFHLALRPQIHRRLHAERNSQMSACIVI